MRSSLRPKLFAEETDMPVSTGISFRHREQASSILICRDYPIVTHQELLKYTSERANNTGKSVDGFTGMTCGSTNATLIGICLVMKFSGPPMQYRWVNAKCEESCPFQHSRRWKIIWICLPGAYSR